MTRRSVAATRRRAMFEERLVQAPTVRERRWALVWWWLAEVKKLSAARHDAEFARLRRITAALNDGHSDVTDCDGVYAMPAGDANAAGPVRRSSSVISAGARDQHTTAPTYVTQRDRAPADTASGSGGL